MIYHRTNNSQMQCSGFVLNHDHDTALNILKKGLEIFGINLPQELWDVMPVDSTDVNDAGSDPQACQVRGFTPRSQLKSIDFY